ncbi:hypothetical protein [Noviherbaspirillum galbum]|uniref:Uncharacterized protein n=1 Tax=Noviherbaspirillum galbum TaxID=2709383 RepID=A0A6B3SHY6_9BURK|nr:hypothetical protein [Noviherbaspirillum galbum]NEX60298.1 hypothetical protein [Noviherbaspirillum galbum]
MRNDQPGKPEEELKTKPSSPGDVQVANGNLARTRMVMKDHPDFYDDAEDGPEFHKIRPLIEGAATFSECIDVSDVAPGYVMLCSLSSDAKAMHSLMLLYPTMNGACGKAPFCAYYFEPLARRQD